MGPASRLLTAALRQRLTGGSGTRADPLPGLTQGRCLSFCPWRALSRARDAAQEFPGDLGRVRWTSPLLVRAGSRHLRDRAAPGGVARLQEAHRSWFVRSAQLSGLAW